MSGQVDRVDVKGLTFKTPKGWEYQHPRSAMRRAELGVRGTDGSAGLVVYFFGNQGAGTSQVEGQPGQRMIVAIVDTPQGPFYFKFLGADKTVLENRKSLDDRFTSMKSSP